jgi:16S rRNA (guanine527-N7)-methyltransferase
MTREELESRSGCHVSRGTYETIVHLVELVVEGSARQNLLSRNSLEDIWTRHVLDSTQLIKFLKPGVWLDLGTGAGFPGMVIAAFQTTEVVVVEERRLRHEFLSNMIAELGVKNVKVFGERIERVTSFSADTISARAFAPINKILSLSERFSSSNSRWILPKGKTASDELASVRTMWHGDFRLEPSATDPDSSIIIAENISLKGRK